MFQYIFSRMKNKPYYHLVYINNTIKHIQKCQQNFERPYIGTCWNITKISRNHFHNTAGSLCSSHQRPSQRGFRVSAPRNVGPCGPCSRSMSRCCAMFFQMPSPLRHVMGGHGSAELLDWFEMFESSYEML